MGSLRNPVGPLPSSIYWRRRAVLLSVLALLALLITWVVVSAGGGGGGGDNGANGKNPAPSITPGPSGSGPAISQAPGGRDESGDDGGPGGSGGSGGTSSGSGGDGAGGDPADTGGTGGSGGGAGGSAGGGSEGGTSAGVGAGDALPAGSGSALPNCTATAVEFGLRSARNTYEPGQTPTFLLTVRNTSGGDCKVDLGPESAVLTVSQASGDAFWASDDCPKGARSLVFRVPAGDSITYTVKWDRKASAPECATPKAGAAGAGTYLLEAKAPGFDKARTSFVLEAA
ncbi:hypothetical protein [Streptomyces pilosus]|uniref:DUF4232 domain-containing protein n=1 Tax=Streptomyces pilosus TaxID=28893 RepID=A0A918F874_9ACTN|nr:hypothetical protein [Streptomyces pilosus]GGR10466.1 hypothetical protein GCM10010280_67640 [Streptomyces pilosus]GGV71082.1 hypothetical protein GCM10010261_66820 [Streptomyces pilosus]